MTSPRNNPEAHRSSDIHHIDANSNVIKPLRHPTAPAVEELLTMYTVLALIEQNLSGPMTETGIVPQLLPRGLHPPQSSSRSLWRYSAWPANFNVALSAVHPQLDAPVSTQFVFISSISDHRCGRIHKRPRSRRSSRHTRHACCFRLWSRQVRRRAACQRCSAAPWR